MKRSKGIQLGELLAVMLLLSAVFVPAVSANSPTSVSDNISETKALEHASVFMLQAVLTKTPGLEDWRGAKVNPEP